MKIIKNQNYVNYKLVKIEDIANIVRGGSPRPIEKYITKNPKDMPWLKIKDATSVSKYIEKTKEYIRHDGVKHSRVVQPGDFIVSNSATPGIPRIMKIQACIHDGWLLLNDIKINKDYLFYIFHTVKKSLENQGQGSIFKNLSKDILNNFQIKITENKDQQKKIAHVLSMQEEQIETIKRIIKNVEKRNQYYSEKLLSGKLRLRKNEATGQVDFYENTEWKEEMVNGVLTKIPSDWEVTLIKNIIPLIKGTSIHSSQLNNLSVGLPYLRTNELWDDSSVNKDKIYFNGDSSTMVKKTINEYIVCFDGFNKEPYKGTLGMVTNNGEGICSGELHKISELQNISKYFVNVMLLKNNRFQLTICRSGEGTTVKHAGKHFKHIEELLIPYKEQELLNDLFKEQLSDIDRLKTLLPKEEKRFQWMLDNLLSGEYEVIDED